MERESNTSLAEPLSEREQIERTHTALTNSPEIVSTIFKPAAQQLLNGPIYNLNNIPTFNGSGVYAIFLIDKSDSPYAERTRDYSCTPIYVGKAVPKGSRQGTNETPNNRTLRSRLTKHAKSINHAENLDISKFACRFIILPDAYSGLIPAIETYIIRKCTPLWNSRIDGFGNNDPGNGRYNQSPSEWDILHPGRPYAEKCTGIRPSIDTILLKLD